MKPSTIAAFLRAIPQSNQEALAIREIVDDENTDVLRGYAHFLQTMGIVQLLGDDDHIKATSQTAKYALLSIAFYVENDLRLVDDWKTRGVYRDDAGALQNGATLLYELESRRLRLLDAPSPSRVEEVVQVLVKRKNPVTGLPELLMQYDENANQYQLIGGRRSPHDDSLLQTVVREIEEEMADNLQYNQDYALTCVAADLVVPASLSPTFGALTEYHFTIYHMTDLSREITLHDNDSWVAIKDLLTFNKSDNDKRVTTEVDHLYRLIDAALTGGIVGLGDSFSI